MLFTCQKSLIQIAFSPMQKSQFSANSIKQACQEIEEAFEMLISDSSGDEKAADLNAKEGKPSQTMQEIKRTLEEIRSQIDELSK